MIALQQPELIGRVYKIFARAINQTKTKFWKQPYNCILDHVKRGKITRRLRLSGQ